MGKKEKIIVESYTACGRIVLKPVCDMSKMIATICKKDSLAPRALKCLLEMGFDIEDKSGAIQDFKSFLKFN